MYFYNNKLTTNPHNSVRHDGARCQWRKVPPRKLTVNLVADEQYVRVTVHIEAS
jgi:hypothetical protein